MSNTNNNNQTSFASEFTQKLESTFVQLSQIGQKPIKEMNIGFFIDVSGSTEHKFNYNSNANEMVTFLDIEKKFVNKFIQYSSDKAKCQYATWSTSAYKVDDLTKLSSYGGTQPECIFSNNETYKVLQDTEVAVIITDGEIDGKHIEEFGKCMREKGCHLKAIIGIIVSRRTSLMKDLSKEIWKAPSEINVSVLVPAMVTNGCIIFYNSKRSYIMWSSGCFKSTWKPNNIDNTIYDNVSFADAWNNVSSFDTWNNFGDVQVPLYNGDEENVLKLNRYIDFGMGLYFNPQLLLDSNRSLEEIIVYPLDLVCQYFRVSQQCVKLYDWFVKQREMYVEYVLAFDDKEFLAKLSNELNNAIDNNDSIQEFVAKRNLVISAYYHKNGFSIAQLEQFIGQSEFTKNIRLFNDIIKEIDIDRKMQSFTASYTSSSLSYTRYTSRNGNKANALTNSSRDFVQHLDSDNDDEYYISFTTPFNKPMEWRSQLDIVCNNHNSDTVLCTICRSIDIPFYLIRKNFDNNILDVVQNPTDYFNPKLLCSKCVEFFCIRKEDLDGKVCLTAFPIANAFNKQVFKNYIECVEKLTKLDYNNDNNITMVKQNDTIKFIIITIVGCLKKLATLKEIVELLDKFSKQF